MRPLIFETFMIEGEEDGINSVFMPPVEDPLLVLTQPYFPVPVYNQSDMDAQHVTGQLQGVAEGKQEMLKSLEGSIAMATTQLLEQIPLFCKQLEENKNELLQQTLAMARAIAEKMFNVHAPNLILEQIEHTVQDCFQLAYQTPKIAVYVPESIQGEATSKLNSLLEKLGSTTLLNIMGDPALPLGNCRCEWQGGALTFDQKSLWQRIDEMLGQPTQQSTSSPPEATPPLAEAVAEEAPSALESEKQEQQPEPQQQPDSQEQQPEPQE